MPFQVYKSMKFRGDSLMVLAQARTIIEDYADKGYDLTLRQLYYQFVTRNWLRNDEKNYKRLGNIISDGRLAGAIDWNSILDRTRHSRISPHWDSPADIVIAAARQFAIDKWADQRTRVEVWIEKDALVGVISGVCERWDVPYLSCRGYISQSEIWRDAQRHINNYGDSAQKTVVLHLGDHDPSGIDMTRDLTERLSVFEDYDTEVRRIALTMDQIEELNLPPNPAKTTDARFRSYMNEYGEESWELDALPPDYIENLIEDHIEAIVDVDLWNARAALQEEGRKKLMARAKRLAQDWKKCEESDERERRGKGRGARGGDAAGGRRKKRPRRKHD